MVGWDDLPKEIVSMIIGLMKRPVRMIRMRFRWWEWKGQPWGWGLMSAQRRGCLIVDDRSL